MAEKEKSSRWQMTVFEEQFKCLEVMPPIVAEWGWQDEISPTTGKLHKQGYVRTHQQQRFAAMRKVFPGVHLEIARDWNKLMNYCKKKDTAVADTQVHEKNDIPSLFTYSTELANRLAKEPRKINTVDDVFDVVADDIMYNRYRGVEWIATNPQFITTWKKYWRQMIYRATQTARQTDADKESSVEYNAPCEALHNAQAEECQVSQGSLGAPQGSNEAQADCPPPHSIPADTGGTRTNIV